MRVFIQLRGFLHKPENNVRGFLHKPQNRLRGFLHMRLLRGFLLRAHFVRVFSWIPGGYWSLSSVLLLMVAPGELPLFLFLELVGRFSSFMRASMRLAKCTSGDPILIGL